MIGRRNPTGRAVRSRCALFTAIAAFFLTLLQMGGGVAVYAKAPGVTDVRTWSSPESTRVVLDLTDAPDYTVTRHNAPPELVIEVKGAVPRTEQREWGRVDRRIKGITVTDTGIATRITVRLARPSRYKYFALSPYRDQKPDRIVVDVLGPLGKGQAQAAPSPPRAKAKTATPEPAPKPAAASAHRPLIVVVDAGHGGEDPGAVGRYHRTREKDIALRIARYLKAELDALPGVRAHMTRDGDYFISLGGRVRKASRLNADLFISIHADTSRNRRTRGTHVYTLSPRNARDRKAVRLAQVENASDLVGGVQAAARLPMIFDADGSPNNTVESRILAQLAMGRFLDLNRDGRKGRRSEARFWVLKGNRPSVLVETGFLSNKYDERALRTPEFQRQIAHRLALAVADYRDSRFDAPPVLHTVRRGESLSRIAARYGVSMREIAKANRIGNLSRLEIGDKLLIPGRGVSGARPAATPVAHKQAKPPAVRTIPEKKQAIVRTYRVRKGDNLTHIARRYGVRLSDLMRTNNLSSHSKLAVGQRIKIPAARSGDRVHVVQRGETLSGLAESYRVRLSELARVNDLKTRSRLQRGQKLIIPGGRGGRARTIIHKVRRGQTLSGLAARYGVSLADLARINGLSIRARLLVGQKLKVPAGSGPRVHIIRRGDSLSRIASLYRVSVSELRRRNGLSGDRLLVGRRLVIPE